MKNLNGWLRKTPKPVAVMADDKRIDVPKGGHAWKELTATVLSLEPSKVTCLDGQGNVLRSIVLDSDEKAGAADASPEMSDVQMFAKLIAEAYDKASSAHAPLLNNAMSFVDQQSQRLAIERGENDRLRLQIHKLSLRVAELTAQLNAPVAEGSEDSVMGAMAAAILQGQADAAASNVAPIKKGAK